MGVAVQIILHYFGCAIIFTGVFLALIQNYSQSEKLLLIGISLILLKYTVGLIVTPFLFGKKNIAIYESGEFFMLNQADIADTEVMVQSGSRQDAVMKE